MTRVIHDSDYLVMSGVGKGGKWLKDSIILQAGSRECAEELADRLLNQGASEVLMFVWDSVAEGWIPTPFTK
jgi:hypothetical protein